MIRTINQSIMVLTPFFQQLELERVLGLTTFSGNMLATSSKDDLIAYAAGPVVVLYNHKKNKQIGFLYPPSNPSSAVAGDGSIPTWTQHHSAMSSLINPMNGLVDGVTPTVPDNKGRSSTGYKAKPISCLAFSPNGAYLAVGEVFLQFFRVIHQISVPFSRDSRQNQGDHRISLFLFLIFEKIKNHKITRLAINHEY